MKILKLVRLDDQEIEVEIDGQDAVNAMMEGSDDWTPEQLVRRACNNFIVVLQKLPDSAIDSQTDAVRKIIADALEEQVKRFRGNIESEKRS